jgi:RNA polymerase-binding protein DksA
MARSTRKSLAGQAASAARKVISRATGQEAEPAAPAPAKKAPAKATAKKSAPPSPKKSAPATKKAAMPAQTTPPAKKAAAAKKAAPAKTSAPVKRTPAQPASAVKAAAKKAPARKAPAKKAPANSAAKKAPASALVVKEGEASWTKTELKEVLDELNTQREHSYEIVEKQESELSGLMRDAGDGAGHDQADMGATSFERDHELTVLSNERDKLAQIDRALARIDDGTYGVCESCGNPVGKMRLMAFPRATLCLTCKQREERR